ncbi:MAG: peptidoglycan glycosyltransferase [Undibacterium sp.]|nr:peptidoglycan glycosyltransferase [Opitutaceae bacterium]
MAANENSLADHSGKLFESHKGYDPRIVFFYFVTAGLLLLLAGGLAYEQLFKSEIHNEKERTQNQRLIIVPAPRGNIYDRHGQLLVGNRPRFAVVLNLDELRAKFRTEFIRIHGNYRETGDKDIPTADQLWSLARVSVVQAYLEQVNAILGRDLKVDPKRLGNHFARELLLPYPLIEDLPPADYAKLIERLPVVSPLQLYTTNTREYPFGSAASQTLGYVGINENVESENFAGAKLKTFKMRGSIGRDGLELKFDNTLQGEAGGSIFRVDPAGYRLRETKPIESRLPVQGKNIVTSLDIDLQLAAEQAIGDQTGAAVAIDIKTGEVLVLASKPDYDLSKFTPRLSHEDAADISARGAWTNIAIGGAFPPGSTFKILTSIAGLRRGLLDPTQPIADCQGYVRIGNKTFVCDNGRGRHGEVLMAEAIAHSCDIYYFAAGRLITPQLLAEEGRRFHLHQRTGIELPNETGRMIMPDPAYKERVIGEKWFPGDTANMSIGQGYVLVTPLEMACFAASVARNEVFTKPTLIHHDNAPVQRTESIGLTPSQRAALIEGMVGTIDHGTGSALNIPMFKIPGVRIAGKTGTAQKEITKDGKTGNINFAWFLCFAPADNPEIAVVVMLEGDTIGETFGGGRNSGPIAATVLKKYFEKKNRPADQKITTPFKTD